MSTRTRREADSRAAARRRSRQLERGELETAEEAAAEQAAGGQPAARRGILSALFPPAPPLPNRPDPLAGFTYSGPLRSVAAWFYLLGRNPRAWLLPAIPWAMTQSLILLTPPNAGALQTISVMVGVTCLLAAGWIGWPKPWLFGLATAVAGTLLQALFLALLVRPLGAAADPVASFFGVILLQISQAQWILAAFVGWYAGYFRRRLASQSRREPQRGRSRR
ncbi:MAG TPA: hypothetical protein VFK61_00945 [Candidatus Limnocylindria bacterium]|jgi:hypothetical protein|nr:hypothetical protein [Candidatus Limnocylindria bacterium]